MWGVKTPHISGNSLVVKTLTNPGWRQQFESDFTAQKSSIIHGGFFFI